MIQRLHSSSCLRLDSKKPFKPTIGKVTKLFFEKQVFLFACLCVAVKMYLSIITFDTKLLFLHDTPMSDTIVINTGNKYGGVYF